MGHEYIYKRSVLCDLSTNNSFLSARIGNSRAKLTNEVEVRVDVEVCGGEEHHSQRNQAAEHELKPMHLINGKRNHQQRLIKILGAETGNSTFFWLYKTAINMVGISLQDLKTTFVA